MIDKTNILFDEREPIVKSKLKEFSNSQIVVTDRLHGMIFAALTGTPCIALNNSDRKVEGVYAWLSDLPFIFFAKNIDDLNKFFPIALRNGAGRFDGRSYTKHFENLNNALMNS